METLICSLKKYFIMTSQEKGSGIGTLQERSLHAALKQWYQKPGDRFEVSISGYIIDIVRDDLLIEIQTSGFNSIKDKLRNLIPHHRVRLVYPIPIVKWVVRETPGGEEISRRKSPKKLSVLNVFEELVSIPTLLGHHNLELEVVEVFEDKVLQNDGKGSWRKKGWSNVDRRLIEVAETHLFKAPGDMVRLIPPDLATPFTNSDLSKSLGCPKRLAQKMTYCLRKMNVIKAVGKQGNAHLYIFQ
ncbi:MAG: hypothetical protein ACFFEF_01440 [Candidatus Thorarchaeota archaeon]